MIMQFVYTGWNSPHRVEASLKYKVAIITHSKWDEAIVLQGEKAVALLDDVQEATHHLCGVKKTPRMEKLKAEAAPHVHDHHFWYAILKEYF